MVLLGYPYRQTPISQWLLLETLQGKGLPALQVFRRVVFKTGQRLMIKQMVLILLTAILQPREMGFIVFR